MQLEAMTDALEVTVRVAGIGIALASIESIVDRHSFRSGGPFSNAVFAVLRGRQVPGLLSRPSYVVVMIVVQLVAVLMLVVLGPLDLVGRIALAVVTVTTIALRWRRVVGSDGAEQLNAIVLVSATLAFVPMADDWRATAATVFVALQAVLAYLTAGVAKLSSPIWRAGAAVPAIVGTRIHGIPSASRALSAHRGAAVLASWAVIMFEVAFPLVLLSPEPIALGILGLGVTFHVGCALIMGLNGFLWAFPATYACVWALRGAIVG